MKRKSIKKRYLDLFGQVVITEFDLYVWVCVITRTRFLGKRYAWYVKNYNVAAKVESAKLNNQWSRIVDEFHEKYTDIIV
jgi:hypothetical protein